MLTASAVVCSVEFVPHIEKLFDESVLIGSGWTTYESLRYVTHTAVGWYRVYRLTCLVSIHPPYVAWSDVVNGD